MPNWLTEDDRMQLPTECCRFVARQPILDHMGQTFGYELLYRDGWENRFSADEESASRVIIDSAVSFGLESLVGKAVPFVNCTGEVLHGALPRLLPHNTVLEVLENVVVDAELVAACRRLRAEGFRIALDDYDFGEQWEPLLPYTDFVKIDFRSSTSADRCKLIKRFEHQSIRFVAEKIEDGTEFEIALKEGFHLFQGYFFTRPVVLARPALSHVVGKVRLMNELRQPDLNYARVISILKEESSIAYRLLRLANSAVMGRREPLIDLTTALRFVGEDTFRMLAFTALTTELCGKQPLEAHRVILQTARFCEQMNATICCEGSELYTFGMLSVVKSILNLSVEALARAVTLDPEMMDALAGEDNSYSRLLRCFSSFESGEWDRFRLTCVTLGSTEEDVIETALAAQRWADDVLTAAA